jgi:abequosyltransferase
MLILTIAIPTYNRPRQILKQLCFLENEILKLSEQFKDSIEIIVSDNASSLMPDDEDYQNLIHRLNVKYRRQERNIGLVANYCYCINEARGKFVWVVGDDDEFSEGLLAQILQLVHQTENLSLIYINHVHSESYDNLRLLLEEPSSSIHYDNFSKFLEKHFDFHGLMKITANVLETSSAKQAIKNYYSWRVYPDNLALPLFVSCYTTNKGCVLLLKNVSISCHLGKSDWDTNRCYWYLYDIPFVLDRLKQLGLDKRLINDALIEHYSKYTLYVFKQFLLKTREDPKKTFQHLKLVFGPLLHWQWHWSTILKVTKTVKTIF